MSKSEKTLKALSLFSGAGGMDIGVLKAGFEVKACLEFDQFACETLKAAVEREKRFAFRMGRIIWKELGF